MLRVSCLRIRGGRPLAIALVRLLELNLREPAKTVDAPENDRLAYLEAPGKARERIAQALATPILRRSALSGTRTSAATALAPALDLMLGSGNWRDIG